MSRWRLCTTIRARSLRWQPAIAASLQLIIHSWNVVMILRETAIRIPVLPTSCWSLPDQLGLSTSSASNAWACFCLDLSGRSLPEQSIGGYSSTSPSSVLERTCPMRLRLRGCLALERQNQPESSAIRHGHSAKSRHVWNR